MFRCFLYPKVGNCGAGCLLAVLIVLSASICFGLDLQAFEAARLHSLAGIEPNLNGSRVNIGLVCRSEIYNGSVPQNNYRPDISHRSLEGARIKFEHSLYPAKGVSGHATAIASIIAGDYSEANLPQAESFYAPCRQAQLNIYEFRSFLVEYMFAKYPPDVDLLSLSLGWSFEDWWTRRIDQMAESRGLLVISAIGNGSDGYDLPLYPAAGANVLAVGVADSTSMESGFGPADANHSTAGPTADGRCKPDIVAPGNCLIAEAGTKNGFSQSGDYSSFAVPVVTSVASLLIQKAKEDPNLSFAVSPLMGNCILKSILMTSAEKSESWHKGFDSEDDDYQYPLDLTQGSGTVNAVSAYKLLTAGMQLSEDVDPCGWAIGLLGPDYTAENVYRFRTGKSEKSRIAVTVVWNRPYSDQYPFEPMWENLADLQIELWKISDRSEAVSIDFSDSPVDNLEHIWAPADPDSEYEIVISNSAASELPKIAPMYAISWQVK